jgi:RecA-family ATPase
MNTTASGQRLRDDIELLPVVRADSLLREPPERRWLVDTLWPAEGVGVIGAHPKLGKTWLGLELAVSISSGKLCLGRFQVKRPGPVLIYLAEDNNHAVRERLDGLCQHHQVSLAALDLLVIDVPQLRLDSLKQLARLDATLARYRPRLLLLDPLVRLHSRDENSSQELTPILGHLRTLQRRHETAIALVHHARKQVNQNQHGQSLRGSGDIFAWADVLLYLHRQKNGLRLTVEHRSAPPPEPLLLQLALTPPHLEIITDNATKEPSLQERILHTLNRSDEPITRTQLRALLAVNNHRLGEALTALEALGRIRRTAKGWHC